MERATAVSGSVWRVAVVAFVSLFVGYFGLADVALPWHPFADFGMQFDAAGNILGVDDGRSAAREGVRGGDRIDVGATPITSRRYIVTGFVGGIEGTRVPFVIARGTTERTVVLEAQAHARTVADNVTDLVLMATELAVLVICSALLLLRPSTMTWAFYWYGCALVSPSVLAVSASPLWLFVLYAATVFSLTSLVWFPFAIFALRFPNDATPGWRGGAQRALLLSLVVIVPVTVWMSIGIVFGVPPPDALFRVMGLVAVSGFVFTALTFAITYTRASPTDRARLRWVILGLTLGEFGTVVFSALSTVPGVAVAMPIPAINTLQSVQILVPITVAYAIVRHRVFDVRFVVGRAVVYALLTTTLVVFVALLDYLVGRLVEKSHLATIAEVAAAIVIGLSLNGLHKRLERIVDTTLFRSRRRAELRLRRIGRGLSHAGSERAITHVIVSEPVAAYALASSALFKRSDLAFERDEAIGWEQAQLNVLDRSASIVLQMQAERKPVAVHDAVWATDDLPHGLAAPAFALPIFVRGQLDAFVFYGPHRSGEDLDPEELEVLEDLMLAASAAYEHAASEIAREKLSLLEAEVASLRVLVATDA